MKKILSLLASLTLASTATLSVVSCAKSAELPPFHNPDYIPDDLHQSEAEKQAINDAVIARLKAAVLTDVYKINKQQTAAVAFRTFSGQDQDLYKVFLDNFTENDFLASVPDKGTQKLDLSGNLGYNGGIIDYLTKELKIDSLLKFLKDYFQIDLTSQAMKDKIFGLLQTGRGVLQTFDGSYLAQNLPDFLKLIPSDLLEKVPAIVQQNLPMLAQKLLNFVLPKANLDPIFNGLVQGTDLTSYKDFTLAQVGDALVVNFVNFYGFGTNPEFQAFDPITLGQSGDLTEVGKYLYTHRDDLASFDLRAHLEPGLKALMQFLGLFNCVMSVYKTSDVQKTDDNHLFSTNQTNDEFVADLQTKILGTVSDDLTHFQIGSLVSNLVYYFGQPTAAARQLGLAKFGYLLTYHGVVSDTNPLPSF
jgi:MOLPALP family lipoprotein